MGIIRGVTTNPTILLKDGVTGGLRGIEARSKEIAKLIAPLPLSVEVTTTDRTEVIRQAQTFAGWADNIVVKVTIHGPEGELENLEIVHELEAQHNIRVNVTAMMSAQQCFLAAMAGATYVSIFGGRVNNMGYNACGEISKLRRVLDQFGLKSQIIVGSTREILNVIEWLEAGAHIVTVLPDLLKGMIVHPYSKETVQQFLGDAARAEAIIRGSSA
jgi:transaldolase